MEEIKDEVLEEKTQEVQEENKESVKAKSKKDLFTKIFYGIAYSIIPFVLFLVVQELSWTGNMLLNKPGAHPEIWLDSKIPLISEFVWIYFFTFPLGIFTYFLVAYKDKKHLWNLWLTLMISFAISGIVYFFWQTEMIKPELNPVTLSDKFLLWTWGSCHPICCLPSQHCFMALGIIIGVSNQKKNISPWLRWTMIVCGVLIIFATVFLKQHYVLDFVASFVIMVPTYLICKYAKFGDHMVKKYGHWVWFGKNNKVKVETIADENLSNSVELESLKSEETEKEFVEKEIVETEIILENTNEDLSLNSSSEMEIKNIEENKYDATNEDNNNK